MNELISQEYFNFTEPIFKDGLVYTFIHKSCEPKAFINNILSYVENLIDINFKIVNKKQNAELKFFETKLVGNNSNYLGLAVPYSSSIGNIWNLYVKSNTLYPKEWIYLHELGHFLGMEHPHEENDSDIWENQTSNDTVMSYNYQKSSSWWFRQADIDTITGMWVS